MATQRRSRLGRSGMQKVLGRLLYTSRGPEGASLAFLPTTRYFLFSSNVNREQTRQDKDTEDIPSRWRVSCEAALVSSSRVPVFRRSVQAFDFAVPDHASSQCYFLFAPTLSLNFLLCIEADPSDRSYDQNIDNCHTHNFYPPQSRLSRIPSEQGEHGILRDQSHRTTDGRPLCFLAPTSRASRAHLRHRIRSLSPL